MKSDLKWIAGIAAVVTIAAVGNIYYEVLNGLVIKHPATGAVTAHINGTNGTVTAAQFTGGGVGITTLSASAVTPVQTNATLASLGGMPASAALTNLSNNNGSALTNAANWTKNGTGSDLAGTATVGTNGLNIGTIKIRTPKVIDTSTGAVTYALTPFVDTTLIKSNIANQLLLTGNGITNTINGDLVFIRTTYIGTNWFISY